LVEGGVLDMKSIYSLK